MDILSINFLPGCPLPAPGELVAKVPILVRWEQLGAEVAPPSSAKAAPPATSLAPNTAKPQNLPREAFGCCSLPTPELVGHLSYILELTQTGGTYSDLVEHNPDYKQAWHTIAGLGQLAAPRRSVRTQRRRRALRTIAALGQSAAPDSWLASILNEPARIIGQALFRSLCAAEGRPEYSVGALINAFLEKHPHSGKNNAVPPADPPTGCILFNFAQLKLTQPWRGALLMLPWEALFEEERPSPLQLDRHLVIVRSVDPNPHRAPMDLKLDYPISTLALTPAQGMTDDLIRAELQARPYHPERHATQLVWCDCPAPQRGLDREQLQHQLDQYQPQLLHYCGHGDYWLIADQRKPAQQLKLDDANAALGAVELHALLSRSFPWLFSCFACHSGSTGNHEQNEQPHTSQRWSLLDALGADIPALLLMTNKIVAQAAGVAGAAWYDALAQGQTLLVAAQALRHALWREAHSRANADYAIFHAWWIPALYIRHPRWDRALVDHAAWDKRLKPSDPNHGAEVRLNARQEEYVARIWQTLAPSEHGQPPRRIVVLHAVDPGVSRTTLLYALDRKLKLSRSESSLLLSAKPIKLEGKPAETPQERLKLLRSVITAHLRQGRYEHVHWQQLHQLHNDQQQAVYLQEIAAKHTRPTWILIDDFDHIKDYDGDDSYFLGLQLLQINNLFAYDVRFVVLTMGSSLRSDYLGEHCESITISKRLYEVSYHYHVDYQQLQAYLATHDGGMQKFVIQLLIAVTGELSLLSIAEICKLVGMASGRESVAKTVDTLTQIGVVLVREAKDQVSSPQAHASKQRRCQLQLQTQCLQAWENDPANERLKTEVAIGLDAWLGQKVHSVFKGEDDLLEEAFPIILQRAVADSKILEYEVVDYNNRQIELKGQLGDELTWIYKWWIVLIRNAVEYQMKQELMLYIDQRLQDETPYSAADTEILRLIRTWLSNPQEAQESIGNFPAQKHQPDSKKNRSRWSNIKRNYFSALDDLKETMLTST